MSESAGRLEFDEIGAWSELKIEIVKKYAAAYSTVLAAQSQPFKWSYIDGFSGPGEHRRKHTGERILGTPIEVFAVEPRFADYHFVDIDGAKIAHLKEQVGNRPDVHTYVGDANAILQSKIFPLIRYEDYRRALCLLDPYGLHLDWSVIAAAGKAKTIEIFLNFPVTDMQRNVFWRNASKVAPTDIERMNRFWGDETWRDAAYPMVSGLFGLQSRKAEGSEVADAFRSRLKKVAKFAYVPAPIPMRNRQGAVVYYLFFASPNKTGARIAAQILKKRRS